MDNKNSIYEISIMGRIIWDLHSLNNEGTVGNVTEPRTIMLSDGEKTDGISGEMLKHIHALRMWELESDKSKFCEACQILEPARADKNTKVTEKKDIKDAIGEAVKLCTLCDIHGFLIQKPTGSRPSAVEFGWALGIPPVYRDIHAHARHAMGEKAKPSGKPEEGNCDGCGKQKINVWKVKIGGEEKKMCEDCVGQVATSQMVYHRPTRSGVYAVISVFRPWRVGLNNVDFSYSIDEDERKKRYQLVLDAYCSMFLSPEGAMTTTRLPHTQGFEGMILLSKINIPVPVISPLKNNYKEEIENIVSKFNNNFIEIKEFDSLEKFVVQINTLKNFQPFTLKIEKEKREKK